jgi:hypothetical protein
LATGWFTDSTTSFCVQFFIIDLFWFGSVLHTIHVFTGAIDAKTGPSAGTSTLTFIVTGKRIASCKLSTTLLANVWPFACVKLLVSF